ncbi:MAG TPA: M13 family metallopeptidase, partial [Rhodanobacteraceae bacterium]
MHKHSLTPIALAISAALALSVGSIAFALTPPAATSTPVKSAPAPAIAITPPQPIAFTLDDQYNPCDNFADYVNAKWNKANPIPADQTRWGGFNELAQRSMQEQNQILVSVATDAKAHKGTALQQKLGNLYAAGMDTAAIDQLGYDPIKSKLAAIDALKTPADIVKFINTSYNEGDGYVFGFGAGADFKDASKQIGYVSQGGLGLPTPAYYTEAKYKDIRDAYVKYLTRSLKLVGTPAAAAAKQAAQVLAFETELAKASLSPTELLNPSNEYHYVTLAEADKVTPHFNWQSFFKSQGVAITQGFSLSQPKFMAEFDKLLTTAPIAQWQEYLKTQLISSAASDLSQPFRDNQFDFYGKTLAGQPEQKPRWKQVVRGVNGAMGMGLGELYVAKYFPPEAKARAEQLVANIRAAFKEHVEHLTWMSPETKQKAIAKLALYLPKIGYPDKGEWRDWSGLTIQPGAWYANLEAASKYNYHYDLSKIGKPTNRKLWGMTPQTVNAYYSDSTNTINFPAAILQPPFFYANGDDAVNYGGIGYVIGHETTHGFDKYGSEFNGHGDRVNWWTKQDRAKFDQLETELEKQYDQYAPIPGKPNLHVNGKLTIREDTADLGGINIAYTALQNALKANPAEADQKIDGQTQDQRFFLSVARVWEGTARPKYAELALNTDPHA